MCDNMGVDITEVRVYLVKWFLDLDEGKGNEVSVEIMMKN